MLSLWLDASLYIFGACDTTEVTGMLSWGILGIGEAFGLDNWYMGDLGYLECSWGGLGERKGAHQESSIFLRKLSNGCLDNAES